jgi:fructose 1,6-bisphosphate aldolase/phosphatase
MKTTLSIIKADIGSIGGHIRPSQKLVEEVRSHVASKGKGMLTDFFISHTGDDIAILFSHSLGKGSEKIHQLAWDAFVAGTKVAKEQGLYGAGQDLLKDSFSGNVRGMGPAVAEMEIEERPNEPFLFFAADKTDPGAYNLPLYLAFADPMYNSGLILSPSMNKGFKFVIMDVNYTEGDRFIELNSPEEIYDIAALLRDNQRFVVESIYSRNNGDIGASVSTTRLHNIAGKYTGKDDPVMLVRVQGAFPCPIQHWPLCGRFYEGESYWTTHAGEDELQHLLFRWTPCGRMSCLLCPQWEIDRTCRCLRPSLLGLGEEQGLPEGDGDSATRLLWGSDVALW